MGKDECCKKVRGINYNLEEKNLLINLANKYKNVIENKKTDGILNAEKERTWKKIETEFNAIAPNNVFRNVSSLKKLYDNLKKNVRKEAANERISILKTGGGKPVSSSNPIKELTLETINHKTVYGLTNEYDSDNIMLVSSPSHTNIENENSWTLETPAAEEENLTSPVLQEENNNKQPTTNVLPNNNVKTWKSRRRPTAPAVALYSNEIAKYYTELGKEKLEVTKLEKEILKRKLLQDQKEHELRCQMLEADLELKRQRLN